MSGTLTYAEFERVDVRVGRILQVEDFLRARNPSYKIAVDFGAEIGVKWSCAQLTNYTHEELIGQQVMAVVNFPPKNIAGFHSEVLILGAPMSDGRVSLLSPTREAVLGGKMF